ncbi:hypothetical protein VKT23_009863 [Stygiomarasmius scandens]|uniref:Uncharacterized protein n=1 Tax=Marasmiellus scandens TaxID=2682957 RepID=A0ABR1JG50_9AGAR
MFMRYTGLGVGHTSTYNITQSLRNDFIQAFIKSDPEEPGFNLEEVITEETRSGGVETKANESDREEAGIAGDDGIQGVDEESGSETESEEGDQEEGNNQEEGGNDEVEHIGYSVL